MSDDPATSNNIWRTITRKAFPQERVVNRVVYLLLFIILCFVILAVRIAPAGFSYQVGEIAEEDIYYTGGAISYESTIRTEAAQNAAAAAVGQIFVVDEAVLTNLNVTINNYQKVITTAQESIDNVDFAALAYLQEELPGAFSDETLNAMLSLSATELSTSFTVFSDAFSSVYMSGITIDEVEAARHSIALYITSSALSTTVQVFFKTLLDAMNLPFNKAYDAVATRQAQDEAMSGVSPVVIRLQSGEKIVSRGSSITAEQIEALSAAGLADEEKNFASYLGLFLLVAAVISLGFLYIRQYQPRTYANRTSMVILTVVVGVSLLLCKAIALLGLAASEASSTLFGYLLPVPAASLLTAVLLERNTAFVSTVVLSIFVGLITNGEIIYVTIALVGGFAAILTSAHLQQRSQMVVASLWIMLANTVVILSFGLIWGHSSRFIVISCLLGQANGLLSSILAMGILPFLESAFGVTTVIRLLELSNSNNPLLKRLMMEAPGTYNHSILVGNLAESAANAIGADALLVRVASYYHDVGKLKRPQFYIENQRPGENPHDKLQPALSAKIITSHIDDGAAMLREARFPEEIIAIMEQHHGNNTLNYFYNKAVETALEPDEINIEDFSYRSTPPQTREAALVMLADSVQAGVQALSGSSPTELEQRVRAIIQEKVASGQLKESPLTFRDVEQIATSFIKVLSGINHLRLNYQELQEQEQEQLLSPKEETLLEEGQI